MQYPPQSIADAWLELRVGDNILGDGPYPWEQNMIVVEPVPYAFEGSASINGRGRDINSPLCILCCRSHWRSQLTLIVECSDPHAVRW
jgi:hypothetical protein